MPKYECRGRLELSGVVFTITAGNIAEARKKARAGNYDEYEIDRAETINCEMNVATVEGMD
jgi:hypothetical protein